MNYDVGVFTRRLIVAPAESYFAVPAAAVGGGDSAELTQFVARITTPSSPRKAAYAALIDGLVADGVWSLLDALWIMAAADSATSLINLKSSSFPLVTHGTIPFSADHGYTGDGSTGYLSTGHNPSTAAGVMTLNSASFGVYCLTSDTAAANAKAELGAISGGDQLLFNALSLGTFINFACNDGNGAALSGGGNAQGAWVVTRTAASGAGALSTYRNGSSTAVVSDTGASSALVTQEIYIGCLNANGTASNFAVSHQNAAAYIGSGLTGANAAALMNRVNTYMTALSINVY